MKIYAQGDVLIELVADAEPKVALSADADGAVVLARGEVTGHRHAFYGGDVAMFRDDGLARDMPAELYIGHIKIMGEGATLKHEEHAPVDLPKGTYRIRRQREWDAGAARIVAD